LFAILNHGARQQVLDAVVGILHASGRGWRSMAWGRRTSGFIVYFWVGEKRLASTAFRIDIASDSRLKPMVAFSSCREHRPHRGTRL